MLRYAIPAVLATLLPMPAQADSVVTLGGIGWTINAGTDALQLQAVVPGGNQPQNIQCVICGANQPQQSPTFGYTDYNSNGGLTNAAFFSTNVSGGGNPGVDTLGTPYTGDFLRTYLATHGDPSLTFSIGVDINDTSQAQTLQSFYMLNFTTHTVLAFFNTPTQVPSMNNGTGFPDYILSGFNLSIGHGGDISFGDDIEFFARLDPQNDGPDSFFLVPTVAAVPGPIAGAGLPGAIGGLMLLGLNWLRRRRREV